MQRRLGSQGFIAGLHMQRNRYARAKRATYCIKHCISGRIPHLVFYPRKSQGNVEEVALLTWQLRLLLLCSFRGLPCCVLPVVPCLAVSRPLTSLFRWGGIQPPHCFTTVFSKLLCLSVKPKCDTIFFSLTATANNVLVYKLMLCYHSVYQIMLMMGETNFFLRYLFLFFLIAVFCLKALIFNYL